MAETWVVDASPVIVLAKIGKLDLLERLGGGVLLPEPVAAELLAGPPGDPSRAALERGWAARAPVESVPTAIIEWSLGAGESAVLALALERGSAVAVLDDAEARSCARALNIRVIGTLGLIVRAWTAGLIESLPGAIHELTAAGLFLDRGLVEGVLDRAARRGRPSR